MSPTPRAPLGATAPPGPSPFPQTPPLRRVPYGRSPGTRGCHHPPGHHPRLMGPQPAFGGGHIIHLRPSRRPVRIG